MTVEQIVKVWNDYWGKHFDMSLHRPVNCVDICDWLIWTDGIYWHPDVMPMYQGTMTQRMNEIAMDMILKGDY